MRTLKARRTFAVGEEPSMRMEGRKVVWLEEEEVRVAKMISNLVHR
jgi:hypothetical protein